MANWTNPKTWAYKESLSSSDLNTQVRDNFLYLYQNLLPVGTILIWSGSVASIPTGFALCNGSNGTPDLRGRFVVGAGGSYAVGNTGGNASVDISHIHGIATEGNHSHRLIGHTIGGVQVIGDTIVGWTGYGYWKYAVINGGPDVMEQVDSMYTTDSGAHSHGGATGSSLSSTDIRPPFYALCYIQKIS